MSCPIGKRLIKVIALAYWSDRPVLLRGGPGIGKSEVLQEAAAAIGIDCQVVDLSLLEPPDLVGIPRIVRGRTRYAPPAFLPGNGSGLLVLEEINRAPREMRAPALQLLTARCLHQYKLPCGWLPAAAINDAADGCDVDELDPALLSRFVEVNAVADVGEWLNWARRHGVHSCVIEFVQDSPDVFKDVVPSPRSWAYVSDIVKTWESECDRDDDVLVTALAGLVGVEWGEAFARVLQGTARPLRATEVIEHYPKSRGIFRRWRDTGRIDLIAATVELLQKHLYRQARYDEVLRDATQRANVLTLMAELPRDQRRLFREWLVERNYRDLITNGRETACRRPRTRRRA